MQVFSTLNVNLQAGHKVLNYWQSSIYFFNPAFLLQIEKIPDYEFSLSPFQCKHIILNIRTFDALCGREVL